MAGFLSTLRRGYRAFFTSVNSTLSTLKKWFRREVSPTLNRIASTIHRWYYTWLHPLAARVVQFICVHPLAISFGALSTIVIIWPGVVSAPLLALFGFTASGPAAGSIASFTQAILGNVTAGGLFATLQSAGMAGFGLVAVNGVVVGTAAFALAKTIIYLIV